MQTGVRFYGIAKVMLSQKHNNKLYVITETTDFKTKIKSIQHIPVETDQSVTIEDGKQYFIIGKIVKDKVDDYTVSKFVITNAIQITSKFNMHTQKLRFYGITKLTYESYASKSDYNIQKFFTTEGAYQRIAPYSVTLGRFDRYLDKYIVIFGTINEQIIDTKNGKVSFVDCMVSKISLVESESDSRSSKSTRVQHSRREEPRREESRHKEPRHEEPREKPRREKPRREEPRYEEPDYEPEIESESSDFLY